MPDLPRRKIVIIVTLLEQDYHGRTLDSVAAVRQVENTIETLGLDTSGARHVAISEAGVAVAECFDRLEER